MLSTGGRGRILDGREGTAGIYVLAKGSKHAGLLTTAGLDVSIRRKFNLQKNDRRIQSSSVNAQRTTQLLAQYTSDVNVVLNRLLSPS